MSIFDEIRNLEKTEGKELISQLTDTPAPVIRDYGCGAGDHSIAAAYADIEEGCKGLFEKLMDQI